jgi:putative two-component system response regulator
MTDRPAILLIDDDPDFVEATCAVLESASYRVLVAYNGDEGLARAQESRPDLIILDVIMPGEDGFQTLENLRADPALAHVPVMMLTSLVNGLSMAPASETDTALEDYIEKPIKPAELLRRVEKYLEQRSTQHPTRDTPLRDAI